MARQTRQTNFRVVVTPRDLGDFGFFRTSNDGYGNNEDARQKEYKRRAEAILRDVERHVDPDNMGNAYIAYDTDKFCEFCGCDWTEDSRTYNGGCCDADESAQIERECKEGGAA